MTRKEGNDIVDSLLDFRTAVEYSFAQVDARFAQVDARFAQMDERIGRGFAHLDDRITALDSKFDEFRGEVLQEIRNLRKPPLE